jgi:class 3 adenylate cyclase
VLFGAPIAHEDDEERALRCALDLRALDAQLRDLRTPARIGVNTGFVYCGLVGSMARQEYTVMGDAVNLAARLMQAAQPGQILAGDTTYRPAGARFEWQPLPPMQVKGKAEPVGVQSLRAVAERRALGLHEPAYDLPLVGRERELHVARGAIDQAARGRGQIVGITADR